jgi:hypothetical protein
VREFLIEVPHARGECAATRAELAHATGATSYRGCEAGMHATWLIAQLATEHDAWCLVPRVLRDTARVIPVTATGRLLRTGGEQRC